MKIDSQDFTSQEDVLTVPKIMRKKTVSDAPYYY